MEAITRKPPNKALFDCSRCNRELNSEEKFAEHMKAHETTPEHLHCAHCHRPYPSEDKLHLHVLAAHKIRSRTFPCEICDFVSPTISKFNDHMRNVSNSNGIFLQSYNFF